MDYEQAKTNIKDLKQHFQTILKTEDPLFNREEAMQDLASFDIDESLTSFYTKVHLKKFINPERLERHIKYMREEQIPALKATISSCKPENQSALPIMKGLYNNWVKGAYPPEETKNLVFED